MSTVTILDLTKENVDNFVDSLNKIIDSGDQKWTEVANSTKFQTVTPNIDPDSREFLDFQMEIWKTITGNISYIAEDHEGNDNISNIKDIKLFYPFVSKYHLEIGNYFIGVSNIIRNLGVNPPARIVEFGIGWGHTTRLMSNIGYDVAAVDIEKRFLDLLPDFALSGSTDVEQVNESFHKVDFPEASVDAVVFFECFHHCIEYKELLHNIHRFLKVGGRIVFCAEPFYDDWFDYPWGVRLDGQAVWAIRNFGWMELGFRKSYLAALLEAIGFDLEWSSINAAGAYGEMLVATKR